MLQKFSCGSRLPTGTICSFLNRRRGNVRHFQIAKPYQATCHNWRGLVRFGKGSSHVPLCKCIKSAPLTSQGLEIEGNSMKNLSLLTLLLVTGCVSGGGDNPNAWYKAGMTADQFRIDSANCKMYASQSSNPLEYINAPAFILESGRVSALYDDCMESKGYVKIGDTNQTVSPRQEK